MKPISNNTGAMQGPRIDITKTLPVVCNIDGCASELFMPAMKFRTVPKLIAATPEDQLIPIQVFVCMSCGSVPEMFDLQV
jgi:hypothetical protein